jgi:hypothetical protein
MKCREAWPFLIPALAITVLSLGQIGGCGGGGREGEEGGKSASDVPLSESGTYLHIVVPSVIRQGEETDIRLRVITQAGLPDYDFEGGFRIQALQGRIKFPEPAIMEPQQEGYYQMAGVVFMDLGVQDLRGEVPADTVQAFANPFVVMEDPEYRIFWGDLDGRSDLSSGSRAPGVYFWYAKAVGLLDFVALTDTDREPDGGKQMDEGAFRDIIPVLEEFDEPGRFVTLPAFEWTSRDYGNRIVLFPSPPQKLFTADAGYDTPGKLRSAVPEGSILIVPHPSGSATEPPADPVMVGVGDEELVEICSSLGAFEAPGTPRASTRETPGASVRDLLARGLHVGFVGGGDTKFTTPGNPHGLLAGDSRYPGGLTAVLAKELTREAILAALRARRCYATTGPRFLLEFTVDGKQMGSELHVKRGHEAEVYGSLGSLSKWTQVEILGPAGPVASLAPTGENADVVELSARTPPVQEPTYVYLRGIDELGHIAWSSPVFLIPE